MRINVFIVGVITAFSFMPLLGAEPDTEFGLKAALEFGSNRGDQLYFDYQVGKDRTYFNIVAIISAVVVAICGFFLALLMKCKGHLAFGDVLRAVIVVFIAYVAVVLALTFPTSETMTGVIGILSAIVGYLFGRIGSDDNARDALRGKSNTLE